MTTGNMFGDAAVAGLPQPPEWRFATIRGGGQLLMKLARMIECLCGVVLAADVAVVFISVVFRYFLHTPVDWAEEVARALMVTLVFLGGATLLARDKHVGIEIFRGMLPARWQAVAIQAAGWVIAGVSGALFYSSLLLLLDSRNVMTPIGLPQWINVLPVCVGSLFMTIIGIANAINGATRSTYMTLLGCIALCLGVWLWNGQADEAYAIAPWMLLCAGFLGCLVIGVPIAFVLAASSLLYFAVEPSLPMIVYSQQVMAGMDHFVLLAIPFFVLAGLLMESNGMSSRLIELLVLMFGRVRG